MCACTCVRVASRFSVSACVFECECECVRECACARVYELFDCIKKELII